MKKISSVDLQYLINLFGGYERELNLFDGMDKISEMGIYRVLRNDALQSAKEMKIGII